MRCYLMKGGHIVSVEELPADASEEEAVYRSWLVFEGRLEFWDDRDDFEVFFAQRLRLPAERTAPGLRDRTFALSRPTLSLRMLNLTKSHYHRGPVACRSDNFCR